MGKKITHIGNKQEGNTRLNHPSGNESVSTSLKRKTHNNGDVKQRKPSAMKNNKQRRRQDASI